MKDQEAIEMMARCRDEIRQLRAVVDDLAPKAAAFEAIQQVLGMMPRTSGGAGPDLAWHLEKRIDELKKAAAAEERSMPKAVEG